MKKVWIKLENTKQKIMEKSIQLFCTKCKGDDASSKAIWVVIFIVLAVIMYLGFKDIITTTILPKLKETVDNMFSQIGI